MRRAASVARVSLPAALVLLSCRPETGPTQPPASPASRPATTKAAAFTPADPFASLPPLDSRDDTETFHFATAPTPPPRGLVASIPFPPPAGPHAAPPPPAVAYPPLEVLRTEPSGAIGMASAVTVTFNQPMVPLTSVGALTVAASPLHLSPLPAGGQFRWLGTQTVAFEPKVRLPMATRFVATVPAGTLAASGQRLAKAVSYTFQTPGPTLVSSFPYDGSDSVDLKTEIALELDQDVDDARVAPYVRLIHAGRAVPLALVPRADYSTDPNVPADVSTWRASRTVVLRPRAPLVPDSSYQIDLRAGLPSAEGPLTLASEIVQSFRTYGPMRVTGFDCERETADGPCYPGGSVYLVFANDLAAQPIAPLVHVAPALPGLKTAIDGSELELDGAFAPGARYTVSVGAGVKDVHGQALTRRWRGRLRMGHVEPSLDFPGSGLVSLEAKGDGPGARTLSAYAVGLGTVDAAMRRLRLADLSKALEDAGDLPSDERDEAALLVGGGLPGKETWSKTLRTGLGRDGSGPVALSADDALGAGAPGLLLVTLHAKGLATPDFPDAPPWRALVVDVTDLGITTRYDAHRIVVLVTRLSTGQPVAGAIVQGYVQSSMGTPACAGVTDAHGLAVLDAHGLAGTGEQTLLVARDGDDLAVTPFGGSGAGGDWIPEYHDDKTPAESLRGFVFTDRDVYRPGETVHIKGLVRVQENRPLGHLGAWPAAGNSVSWSVEDETGTRVAKGKTQLSPFGSFTADFAVPGDAELGQYGFQAVLSGAPEDAGDTLSHAFQVQEYRTPEFKVAVKTPAGPFVFGDRLHAVVSSRYYFGAPVAGAQVDWTLTRTPTPFIPPGQDDFTFGEDYGWTPIASYAESWRGGEYGGTWNADQAGLAIVIETGTGTLGPDGNLAIDVPLAVPPGAAPPAQPFGLTVPPTTYSFTLEASVTDADRKQIAGRTSVLAHQALAFVGERLDQSLVQAGTTVPVHVVVADPQGDRLAGLPVKVQLVERQTKQVIAKQPDGSYSVSYQTKEVVDASCAATSAPTPATCSLVPPRGGDYLLRATSHDAAGRATRTDVELWVSGPDAVTWQVQDPTHVELIPDKKQYAPGDTAHILVESPFASGAGLVTVEQQGIVSYQEIPLDGTARTVDVPITADDVPDVTVAVSLERGRLDVAALAKLGMPATAASAAADLGRPAYATGQVPLSIDVARKRLSVTVHPAPAVTSPGASIAVRLATDGADGRGVRSEVAVMAVDEAVLALLGTKTPDPLAAMWGPRSDGVGADDARALLLRRVAPPPRARRHEADRLEDRAGEVDEEHAAMRLGGGFLAAGSAAPETAAPMAAPAAPMTKEPAQTTTPALRVRSLFATTAFWAADVVTAEDGTATASFELPDNLTTYRVMAVAADATDRFGSASADLTVRKKILLRPALPRFVDVGDSLQAAVSVNNQTGADADVQVLLRGTGITIEGGAGADRRTVHVPKDGEAEVRFPIEVTGHDKARLQFAAVAGAEGDAVEQTLPIELPATAEAFATYGTTDLAFAQPIAPPAGALPTWGGLDVSLSSTALTNLTDAVSYLVDYPYECAEQTASRILPIAELSEIIPDFHLGSLADRKAEKALVAAGVRRLLSLQNGDGGFRLWSEEDRSDPYVSGWVTFVLARVADRGFAVPSGALESAAVYLTSNLDHPFDQWGEEYDDVTQTLDLYVLSDPDMRDVSPGALGGYVRRLYRRKDRLPLYARAWLAVAIGRLSDSDLRAAELWREIENAAVEEPATAHFSEGTSETLQLLMHTDDLTDAVIADAMIEQRKDDPLLPKVIHGLNDARVDGRWDTTQSNAWALLAMADYYRAFESETPEMNAGVWLGDDYVGGTKFEGRSMEVDQLHVPMAVLARQGAQTLTVGKHGAGRLYYRLGLQYAPASLELAPSSQGFMVQRSYEPLDAAHAADVTKNASGGYVIRAGATVRVRLTVVVHDRGYYVALDDPLPAGLEPQNLAFRTTARAPAAEGTADRAYDSDAWMPLWVWTHKELRDDRAVAFADSLPAGVYEYTYLARATSIGTFRAAPTRVSEMYAPEVFGRSATDHVQVVAP